MGAPPGSVVGLHMDGPSTVEPGDVIVSAATGRSYRVDTARRQQRGARAGRWHLRAVVLAEPVDPHDPDEWVHLFEWYRR